MSSVPSAVFQEQGSPHCHEAAASEPQAKRGWAAPRGLVGGLQIVGILAVVSMAVGFSREDPATVAPVPVAMPEPVVPAAGPLLSVLQPQVTASRVTVEATGSVAVRNRVGLVPEVSGRVVSVSPALRAGGSFSAGEELLRVDASEFQLALDQARADLSVARSKLRLQQAESEAARINYGLVHPGKPVPALVAKLPQVQQRQAEIAAAEARVAMAALELSRTRFSLPFDGKITSSSAELGQVLSKGQSFGQAYSLTALEVVAPIAQDELARLGPVVGASAVVTAGEVVVNAVVERVSAELDQRTRFAKAFLTLDAAEGLLPGTFVEVVLQGPVQDDTFVLPEAAEQMNGSFWVVDDGALRRVTPRLIGRGDEGLIVEAFAAGEGVVLGPVPGARDGMAVRTAAAGA